MEKNELIGSVRKNAMENIRVHVRKYRGGIYVDVRVWVQDFREDAKAPIATKKGLCLRPEVVRKLLPLLSEALAKAEALDPLQHANGVF